MEFIRHRKSHTVTGPVHYVCHAGLSHLSSYAGHKIQLFPEDFADWKALRSFFCFKLLQFSVGPASLAGRSLSFGSGLWHARINILLNHLSQVPSSWAAQWLYVLTLHGVTAPSCLWGTWQSLSSPATPWRLPRPLWVSIYILIRAN